MRPWKPSESTRRKLLQDALEELKFLDEATRNTLAQNLLAEVLSEAKSLPAYRQLGARRIADLSARARQQLLLRQQQLLQQQQHQLLQQQQQQQQYKQQKQQQRRQ
mmetsp:Transcript_43165/g.109025  ORF Transcript_43165/g.109025 Transcript_43165/m.109025 type:complete len:106 (+) Transcript_43165:199-516(+)